MRSKVQSKLRCKFVRVKRTRPNAKRHLAVAFLLFAGYATGPQAAPTNGFGHIALDAGHNVKTQGAISARGVAEFEFNRQLVLTLDAEFKKRGVKTKLIGVEGRTEDCGSLSKFTQ